MVLIKFEENLIKISKGNNWEQASKEWGFLWKRERDNRDNHCLCGTKLKHQYYYYNKNTKKIICCGMECKKHIDDYRGNREYSNDFINDIVYILGQEYVGDYDLEKYCKDNEQIVWDKMFWRIELFNTEKLLSEYYDYLEEYWSDLLNIDCLLEKINEKIQGIWDREDKLEELRKIKLNEYKLEQENIKIRKLKKQWLDDAMQKVIDLKEEKEYEEQLERKRFIEKKTKKKKIISRTRQLKEYKEEYIRNKERQEFLKKEIEKLNKKMGK